MAADASPPAGPSPPVVAVPSAVSSDDGPERRRERTRAARLVAIFLAGCAALVAPLLEVASRPALIAGLPVAWVYLFSAWAGLIALVAFVVRYRQGD